MRLGVPVGEGPSRTVREILRDIRFEQTLFSLPFAALVMVLAADGLPAGRTVGLILLALVSARSAAMAVNRAADARIDARNPRTASTPRAKTSCRCTVPNKRT